MKGWTVDAFIFIGERERVNEKLGALFSWMMENRETIFTGGS